MKHGLGLMAIGGLTILGGIILKNASDNYQEGVKLKAGVILNPTEKLKEGIASISSIAKSLGIEFIITSGNDGRHMIGSKHYTDEAIDIRTKHLNGQDKELYILTIEYELSLDFDVLFEYEGTENEHLHVEVA